MTCSHARTSLAVLVCLVSLACGSPTSPDGQGVSLRGTVVGAVSSLSAASSRAGASAAAAATVTVRVVEQPAITAVVGADGTFTLRGLPEGGFTLEFLVDGVSAGTVAFGDVRPNQEITITVAVNGNTVTVLEQKRDGIGHGDVEIEGDVTSVLVLDPLGESRFVIAGRTVAARPGATAIREGNRARTVADVAVGRHVHVKGVWLDAQAGAQPVLAHEIKLQGSGEEELPPPTAACMINGGRAGERIELEGHVESGGAGGFLLRVQGNRASGPVQVDTAGAGFECTPASGPNAPTPAQCQASVTGGAKVHVRGTLQACDSAAAVVRAATVKVQK
jgi:hypothetical protein